MSGRYHLDLVAPHPYCSLVSRQLYVHSDRKDRKSLFTEHWGDEYLPFDTPWQSMSLGVLILNTKWGEGQGLFGDLFFHFYFSSIIVTAYRLTNTILVYVVLLYHPKQLTPYHSRHSHSHTHTHTHRTHCLLTINNFINTNSLEN